MSETPVIRLVVAALALIVISIGSGHAQTVQKVEIYEFGTYDRPDGVEFARSHQGITNFKVRGIALVQATQTVLARIGVNFGFRFHIVGHPSDASVAATVRMKIPRPGIAVPGTQRRFVEDEFTDIWSLGSDNFYVWCFDKDEKMVPGTWTFELWINGKKFAEQKFNVVLPPIAQLDAQQEPGT